MTTSRLEPPKKRHYARIVAAAFLLVSLSAVGSIAHAAVTKSGTKNCTTNQTGVSRALSSVTTEHYPPGAGYGVFYNGSTFKTTIKAASRGGGGFWVVASNGTLSSPGTYAYCINGTP